MKFVYAILAVLALLLGCTQSQETGAESSGEDGDIYRLAVHTGYCIGSRNTASPFAGGTGTSDDPYRICTKAQFLNITEEVVNSDFILMTDIGL